jgi:hypothetical protein
MRFTHDLELRVESLKVLFFLLVNLALFTTSLSVSSACSTSRTDNQQFFGTLAREHKLQSKPLFLSLTVQVSVKDISSS